ncbi:MAG: DUF4426 domain-containing protein [Gammaproteobacteria bacterium TMED1]|nr:MAG: DUF4426 domain-containing protein [Gammaproteobacteria bacterium TMED1]
MQKTFFLWLLLIFSGDVVSQQTENWKDYEIHFAVIPSVFVSKEVAKAHGIIRARGRMITNIAITKRGTPIRARVKGTASNLLKQHITLQFLEIIENQTVYYIANNILDEKDNINYKITIKPEDESEPYELLFTRQYY